METRTRTTFPFQSVLLACLLGSVLLQPGVTWGQFPETTPDDALAEAIFSGETEALLPLLSSPSQANKRIPSRGDRHPLLVVAARAGHADQVRLLIAKGADVPTQGDHAMREAMTHNHLEVITALIEGGVKVDGPSGDQRLAQAVIRDSLEIAELLRTKGANLAQLPEATLYRVAAEGSANMRAWLSKHKVTIPAQSMDEMLIEAIWAKNLPEVKRLVSKGGINWDRNSRSVGVAAAATGDRALFMAVVNRIDVNHGDGLLRTPLWIAAARGDVSLATWLLEHGAKVDAKTHSGQTALGVATALGHQAMADLLLKHGASPLPVTVPRVVENDLETNLAFPPDFKTPTVAMTPVVIDDGWYASLVAASNFGTTLEAEALALPEVHWVERAEVERLGGEWATSSLLGGDDPTALQKGRLARADWMVTTHIFPDEGLGRTLVFEVIDTRTAESLAQHEIKLSGEVGWPFRFETAREPALAGLRTTLAAAAHTVKGAQGRKRLACLFFANQTPTDRFVTLAGTAMETMASVAESSGGKLPHVVRFRRSQTVAGESELAAAGWLDQGRQGLDQVSDAFAWGRVTEAGNNDAPFEDVLIKLTWEVWSGNADIVKHEAVCRVGDVGATLATLSGKVLANLPTKGDLANLNVRRTIANSLMNQAQALRRSSESNALRWRERVGLLEAAHFLNPERATLQAAILTERWNRSMTMSLTRYSLPDFRRDFQAHTEYDRFIKSLGPGQLEQDQVGPPDQQGAPKAYGDVEMVHLEGSRWELNRSLRRDITQIAGGVPTDLPPLVRLQWLAALTPKVDLVPLFSPPITNHSESERYPDRKAKADMTKRLATELAKTKDQPGWLQVSPEVRELPPYYRDGSVRALSVYKGRLYLVVVGITTEGEGFITTVWEHDMAKNTFALVPGMEFKLGYDYIHLSGHETGLWLWTNQDGICHRDWNTGEVTHHESSTGLPTDQVYCGVALGGTMYFGGGRDNNGALFSWDVATRSWRVLSPPDAKKKPLKFIDRLCVMGDELFVLPRYSAVNPATKTWRDLGKFLYKEKVAPWEACVTGQALWSWGPQHFARVDLGTMTYRPVVPVTGGPKVTGWFSAFARTDDFVWVITREIRHGGWNEIYNLNRLFAINQDDATVQSAILLPLACKVTCAVAHDGTIWMGTQRGPQTLPCLIRVRLGD